MGAKCTYVILWCVYVFVYGCVCYRLSKTDLDRTVSLFYIPCDFITTSGYRSIYELFAAWWIVARFAYYLIRCCLLLPIWLNSEILSAFSLLFLFIHWLAMKLCAIINGFVVICISHWWWLWINDSIKCKCISIIIIEAIFVYSFDIALQQTPTLFSCNSNYVHWQRLHSLRFTIISN